MRLNDFHRLLFDIGKTLENFLDICHGKLTIEVFKEEYDYTVTHLHKKVRKIFQFSVAFILS